MVRWKTYRLENAEFNFTKRYPFFASNRAQLPKSIECFLFAAHKSSAFTETFRLCTFHSFVFTLFPFRSVWENIWGVKANVRCPGDVSFLICIMGKAFAVGFHWAKRRKQQKRPTTVSSIVMRGRLPTHIYGWNKNSNAEIKWYFPF